MNPKIDIDRQAYERLASAGLSHAEISKALYVGTMTLSRWKKRNGISSYRKTSEYTDLRNEGYKDKQIAQKWGITPAALYQWKKGRGLV